MPEKEWYQYWFDSPYYHILYKYRNEAEAEGFIDAMLTMLQPSEESRILDLACGKGRYSRHLADKGYKVVGIDLSQKSIEYARQFENERLAFYTHDMRKPLKCGAFDYVLNFFTSFGYFESESDDLKTLQNVARVLKKEGTFVLDFFNSNFVISNLKEKEIKTIDNITFDLHKYLKGNYVFKDINFDVQGKKLHYREKVRLFTLSDFHRLFELAGFRIIRTFGDYKLSPFNPVQSPRLIIEAKLK